MLKKDCNGHFVELFTRILYFSTLVWGNGKLFLSAECYCLFFARVFFRKAEAKQVSLNLNIYEKEMLAGKFLCVRVKHALNQ